MKKVFKIRSYNELKNEPWFVDDMKNFCGRMVEITFDFGDGYVLLSGCSDWQWLKSSLVEI